MSAQRTEHRQAAGQALRQRVLAGLPVVDRTVEVAGIPTGVFEGGDGEPLLLLHGQGEFGPVWAPAVADLVATHRVIVADLPGHGASGVGKGPLDVPRILAWLDELIETTCSASPVVSGHLLGGAIAMRYAADRQDAVRALVLVDTLGLAPYRPSPAFFLAMVGFAARPTERSRDRLFNQCFADFDKVREEFVVPWEDMGAYALACARRPELKTAMRSLMPRFGMPTIPDELIGKIDVPVSLIHGRGDRQVKVEIAETSGQKYGWPLQIIDGAGDDPAVEQPQAFNKAMRAALAD
ncbi:MAG: alpha/beta hydrolase [Actinobacteria bacterium]|nr:alpha/beta hydrolase [Actinomycetota bacterium]